MLRNAPIMLRNAPIMLRNAPIMQEYPYNAQDILVRSVKNNIL
jgi:hypothetical protein